MDLDGAMEILFLSLLVVLIMVRVRNTTANRQFSRNNEEHSVIVFANQKLRHFINWLATHADPRVRGDPMVRRLIARYQKNNTRVRAIPPSVGYAAYTRDKGAEMTLCIPEDKREMHQDTVTFVLTHELAHMASNGWDHDKEFKRNFKRLLELALEAKVYNYQPFSPTNPGRYCGSTIKHTPIKYSPFMMRRPVWVP